MSGRFRTILPAFAIVTLVAAAPSWADQKHFDTTLSGFHEVHAPSANFATPSFNAGAGAIFSTGDGRLKLQVDERAREIRYELTYEFPDAGATTVVGTQFVNQAHLHFGQKHTTGGITIWLCQSADSPAPTAGAGAPVCPSPSGTVSGVIQPANVIALPNQGLPGGQDGFDAVVEALRSGAIYGNVHTDRFPPGEIRGQFGKNGEGNQD